MFLIILLVMWPIGGIIADEFGQPIGTSLNPTTSTMDVIPDNVGLTQLFLRYEADTSNLVDALSTMMATGGTPTLWNQARQVAVNLKQQSFHLLQLGKHHHNPTWEYYASNLYHHCLEMEEAILRNDGRESIFLIAILVSHIGQIQSANPRWLVWYVGEQIHILESGIKNRDKVSARNASEIIHTSANKILLSASIVPEVYTHLNWRRNIVQLNGLGDTILGEVNQEDWQRTKKKVDLIKHLYLRWKNSFRILSNDS